MKVIVFAGGTGKRFWPVSRVGSPKQFLPVVDNKPLIRLKIEYLSLGFDYKDIFVSTGLQYKKEVMEILPEIPKENFIFEPEMKDTGPAVLYASAYVNSKFPNETIAIQWADHYIRKPNIFVETIKKAEEIVNNQNKIVIVSVPARFATQNRGYIKFGKKIKSLDKNGDIILCEFVRFVEKPTLEVAHEYIKSGDYGWNPGYSVLKPKVIFEYYKKFAPEIYDVVNNIAKNNFSEKSIQEFKKIEKRSFDYIFSENLEPKDTLVINSNMGWNDIGEWITLKEALEESRQSNVILGNNVDLGSTDTIIYNDQPDKLVATTNLNGFVVVNTKDVVAVFHKDDNTKLKELIKILEEKGLTKYL